MAVWIKICGITNIDDARLCLELGVDAIGLNFAKQSARYLEPARARVLVRGLGNEGEGMPERVGVFVDEPWESILRIAEEVELDRVQLHGHESPEELAALLARGIPAYKAVRVASSEDVRRAQDYGGDRLLVDAKVAGAMGGTGTAFDWNLISDLNRLRKIVLAGGLKPENVVKAVSDVAPFGVDTASGVETRPGVKDHDRLRAFVSGARNASKVDPRETDSKSHLQERH